MTSAATLRMTSDDNPSFLGSRGLRHAGMESLRFRSAAPEWMAASSANLGSTCSRNSTSSSKTGSDLELRLSPPEPFDGPELPEGPTATCWPEGSTDLSLRSPVEHPTGTQGGTSRLQPALHVSDLNPFAQGRSPLVLFPLQTGPGCTQEEPEEEQRRQGLQLKQLWQDGSAPALDSLEAPSARWTHGTRRLDEAALLAAQLKGALGSQAQPSRALLGADAQEHDKEHDCGLQSSVSPVEPTSTAELQVAGQVPEDTDREGTAALSAGWRRGRLLGSHAPYRQRQDSEATAERGSGSSGFSRYEMQKWRDWQTFEQFLGASQPSTRGLQCGPNHVVLFLRYLDQFGKTRVHEESCRYYGTLHVDSCSCPVRQAWGSLDSLIGRLRAAFEEHGGSADSNPFAHRLVRQHLKEVRDLQGRARGSAIDRRRRKRDEKQEGAGEPGEDALPEPGKAAGHARRVRSSAAPATTLLHAAPSRKDTKERGPSPQGCPTQEEDSEALSAATRSHKMSSGPPGRPTGVGKAPQVARGATNQPDPATAPELGHRSIDEAESLRRELWQPQQQQQQQQLAQQVLRLRHAMQGQGVVTAQHAAVELLQQAQHYGLASRPVDGAGGEQRTTVAAEHDAPKLGLFGAETSGQGHGLGVENLLGGVLALGRLGQGLRGSHGLPDGQECWSLPLSALSGFPLCPASLGTDLNMASRQASISAAPASDAYFSSTPVLGVQMLPALVGEQDRASARSSSRLVQGGFALSQLAGGLLGVSQGGGNAAAGAGPAAEQVRCLIQLLQTNSAPASWPAMRDSLSVRLRQEPRVTSSASDQQPAGPSCADVGEPCTHSELSPTATRLPVARQSEPHLSTAGRETVGATAATSRKGKPLDLDLNAGPGSSDM